MRLVLGSRCRRWCCLVEGVRFDDDMGIERGKGVWLLWSINMHCLLYAKVLVRNRWGSTFRCRWRFDFELYVPLAVRVESESMVARRRREAK